jgi:putative thioredoxin
MSTNVKDVTAAEFAHAVLERSHEVPVVVDFWAEWCGPCKVLGPTLERLAGEGAGSWELAKVDVDQNQQLAMQFGVQGIPTVIGFKDGRPAAQFTGAVPERQVRDFISSLVPSELDVAADRAYIALDEGNEEAAEATWRAILAEVPSHEGAGVGLAGLLLDRGDNEAALDVLARLAPTEAVRQMQAAARLSGGSDLVELEQAAASGGIEHSLAYARGLAAAGDYEDALDRLIEIVSQRQEPFSEEARTTVLDLFELLGPENQLTSTYRRRLASALF